MPSSGKEKRVADCDLYAKTWKQNLKVGNPTGRKDTAPVVATYEGTDFSREVSETNLADTVVPFIWAVTALGLKLTKWLGPGKVE